jgi:hypothetical protein
MGLRDKRDAALLHLRQKARSLDNDAPISLPIQQTGIMHSHLILFRTPISQ